MIPASGVVPETTEPTEAEFRAAVLGGLSRCSNTPAGKRVLAGAMDLSTKGLDNILLRGASPEHKRMWDARRACPHVLDDVAALYGCEIVDRAHAAAERIGTLPLAALLAKVAEAESPSSPGGTAKTHQELLAMEADIRAVHALTAGWIEEITAVRKPRLA